MFAILVLMALVTTFMTTPAVLVIYKPLRRVTSRPERRLNRQLPAANSLPDEFRIQACIHGPENVPSHIKLIELFRANNKSPLKIYVMRLVEFADRSSAILMVQKARKNGVPFTNRFRLGMSKDPIAAAFEAYSQLGRVTIRHSTAISALSTIHEDIFHVAEKKRVAMIIFPFHKQWKDDGEGAIDRVGWREVNGTVLQSAPCSVAVFVDRGFGCGFDQTVVEPAAATLKRVCIVFFGGPDDGKALELGARMAANTGVKVTLIRFTENSIAEMSSIPEQSTTEIFTENSNNFLTEQELDETMVEEFRRKWNESIAYEEKTMSDIKDKLLMIGQSRDYELVVVGKGRFPSIMEAKLSHYQVENVGLGPVGNILASSDHGIFASVLVIQQHDVAEVNEATL